MAMQRRALIAVDVGGKPRSLRIQNRREDSAAPGVSIRFANGAVGGERYFPVGESLLKSWLSTGALLILGAGELSVSGRRWGGGGADAPAEWITRTESPY